MHTGSLEGCATHLPQMGSVCKDSVKGRMAPSCLWTLVDSFKVFLRIRSAAVQNNVSNPLAQKDLSTWREARTGM